MLRLVFTDRAQLDVLEAWLYIAEDNPKAADRVLDTIDQESKILLMQPLMGRARPELLRCAVGQAPHPISCTMKLMLPS